MDGGELTQTERLMHGAQWNVTEATDAPIEAMVLAEERVGYVVRKSERCPKEVIRREGWDSHSVQLFCFASACLRPYSQSRLWPIPSIPQSGLSCSHDKATSCN